MRIMTRFIVLDASDIDTEAAFWAAVLGGTVRASTENSAYPDWRDIQVDGETVLGVQLAPDHVPPQWPGTSPDRQRQQLHWDLYVARDEVESACREVAGLGASLLQRSDDPEAADGFHVFADPAGHPFCICWG
ncbi:glyoxalase [Brachybacterium sp. P6-10-X1]|nr:VOC family protein [Brachybacterium sp. P6-10-X1]APX33420.1 glyoxalase [Brachybacterium sp. P6-10-X1]